MLLKTKTIKATILIGSFRNKRIKGTAIFNIYSLLFGKNGKERKFNTLDFKKRLTTIKSRFFKILL